MKIHEVSDGGGPRLQVREWDDGQGVRPEPGAAETVRPAIAGSRATRLMKPEEASTRPLSRRILTAATALIFCALSTLAAEAQEPGPEAQIDRTMEAAAAAVAREAVILDAEGDLLREGTNGWTCFSEIAPGYGVPMCGDKVWTKFREALLSQSDFSTDRVGLSYRLAGDAAVNNADPCDKTRDDGEVWVQKVALRRPGAPIARRRTPGRGTRPGRSPVPEPDSEAVLRPLLPHARRRPSAPRATEVSGSSERFRRGPLTRTFFVV